MKRALCTPGQMQRYEVLVGFGIVGIGFGVILAVVGRAAAPEHPSTTLGIATAAGSLGQMIGAPAAEYLLLFIAWQSVFLIFAGVIIASLLALPFMRSLGLATRSELEESLGTIAAAVFFLMPVTPASVLVFSAVMGSLWLATVPLTSGLVADIYGVWNMGTVYGFVFLSHQIGGFPGAWLGGAMYDATGCYALVWWIEAGVGAFPAIVHLPIREARPPAQPA